MSDLSFSDLNRGKTITEPVLTAESLSQRYALRQGVFSKPSYVHAVREMSFSLARGRTLAIVGESGCGKTTLARMLTMIEPPRSGYLRINGVDPYTVSADRRRMMRRHIQMVFQNPYGSLNPRQKVGNAIGEPLVINGSYTRSDRLARVVAMMKSVGLGREHYHRYPHMFSGGQRQRIAIARALITEPDILVLDEPVSALDISVQAQILNLLRALQDQLSLAYIFISHDLSVVRHVADEVIVMYLGRVVEQGKVGEIFSNPRHPYTQALLSATPIADPEKKRTQITLHGELPSPINPPKGCAFHPRCFKAFDRCSVESPELELCGKSAVACFAAEK